MALTGMSPHEVDRIARQVAREEVEAYMQAQAKRCEELYARATSLLPQEDYKALLAPRVMHRIYHTLLGKMKKDNFRVFDRRYRLNKLQKLALLTKESFS